MSPSAVAIVEYGRLSPSKHLLHMSLQHELLRININTCCCCMIALQHQIYVTFGYYYLYYGIYIRKLLYVLPPGYISMSISSIRYEKCRELGMMINHFHLLLHLILVLFLPFLNP